MRLNSTDINPVIFFNDFFHCHEKVHDNKELSDGNSKPYHESQIKTC